MANLLKMPGFYLAVLFCVNIIYFLDRGIIPGSSEEFESFISKKLQTQTPDAYVGMLQSAFVVGLLVSSVLFGHIAHFHKPFDLVKFGAFIWILSVLLSGLSYYCNSFAMLILARMLSGVGEGSFQCTMPPWIELNAPSGSKGKWLSVFYTAMPVGTAVGYAYSASVTTAFGWPFAFFIESIAMLPFLCIFHIITIMGPGCREEDKSNLQMEYDELPSGKDDIEYVFSPADEDAITISSKQMDVSDYYMSERGVVHANAPSVLEELSEVMRKPIFLCLVAGYAAQTASVMALATFCSSIVMGLGYFNTEMTASSAFGAVISLAGLVGTPLGGLWLDKQIKHNRMRSENRTVTLRTATAHITALNVVALGVLLLLGAVGDRVSFLLVACVGSAFIFSSTTGIAIAVMEAVPHHNRAFAMAIVTVLIHLLGDVPSPILAGLLKDKLAPACVGNGAATTDPCRSDASGLKVTMVVVVIWLGWSVLFFGLAWRLSVRKSKRSASLAVAPEVCPEPWLSDNNNTNSANKGFREPLVVSRVVV